MLSCDETDELLPEYVLGALGASETADVARHLRTCGQHVASLNGYEAVCDGLCASVPMLEAPPQLKARLLARVARPAVAPKRADRTARLGWAFAAVAAVLALVFGVWGASLQGRLSGSAASREKLVALAGQPGTRMLALDTTAAGGAAKGVLFLAQSQSAVWAVGLPRLEGDQVYQCWWIDSANQRVSGGTFKPDSDTATWFIPGPDNIKEYRGLGITLEPKGESLTPQGPRVMGSEF